MHRSPIRSNIRPKISTMPRQESEAAAYLDIYKLVVEKKRLQQELVSIEQRHEQINNRLNVLENQIQTLEGKAHQLRKNQEDDAPKEKRNQNPSHSAVPESSGQFKTITLEY